MRFCIDYYKGIYDEIGDDEWGLVNCSDIISEYFDDESEFVYRLHELEKDEGVNIDGTYTVELVPYYIG